MGVLNSSADELLHTMLSSNGQTCLLASADTALNPRRGRPLDRPLPSTPLARSGRRIQKSQATTKQVLPTSASRPAARTQRPGVAPRREIAERMTTYDPRTRELR